MGKHAHEYDKLTDAQLMAKVQRGWQCDETPCGTGSTMDSTGLVREHLPKIVAQYGIKTVSDAGAGDLHWMPSVDWDVEYQGYDLFPRHADVKQFDMCKEVLPQSDLIICRHVLNHLSIQKSEQALANFKASGSKYLLMTMCENQLDYWGQYDLSLDGFIDSFADCAHWWLELYQL